VQAGRKTDTKDTANIQQPQPRKGRHHDWVPTKTLPNLTPSYHNKQSFGFKRH